MLRLARGGRIGCPWTCRCWRRWWLWRLWWTFCFFGSSERVCFGCRECVCVFVERVLFVDEDVDVDNNETSVVCVGRM